ncbi:MAG TPA: hypothetical protein VGQ62_12275 [Chloroflexota bacterium]|jgi:hypothetical protein|nr:hypothetical protein [Chloroflexota bacterium]
MPRLFLPLLNGLLLAAIALAVARTQLALRDDAAVEASVRRYATAVSNADLEGALAEIAPDQRAKWQDWISGQLGNVYEVRGVAVRSPSVLRQVSERFPRTPFEATAILDVNRAFPDEFYQPTTRVPVEIVDARPYLAAPLLATD